MNLTFDHATHTYRLDDRLVPSVTQIVNSVRTERWTPSDLQWYLERGKMVHRAIQLALDGTLDRCSVDHRILGRVAAAEKFVLDSAIEPTALEVQVFHPQYRYAGTADAIFVRANRRIVVDWKGAYDKQSKLQVGLYSLASPDKISLAAIVELHDDGTYKAYCGSRTPKRDHADFDLASAERAGLAALTLYNWNTNHE